jgi:hypothetical protein
MFFKKSHNVEEQQAANVRKDLHWKRIESVCMVKVVSRTFTAC